jgi:hypothetical protein
MVSRRGRTRPPFVSRRLGEPEELERFRLREPTFVDVHRESSELDQSRVVGTQHQTGLGEPLARSTHRDVPSRRAAPRASHRIGIRSVLCSDAEVLGEATQKFGIHAAMAEQHLLRHDRAEPAVVTSQ